MNYKLYPKPVIIFIILISKIVFSFKSISGQSLVVSKRPLFIKMKIGDPIFCVNVNLYLKPERREEFIRVSSS